MYLFIRNSSSNNNKQNACEVGVLLMSSGTGRGRTGGAVGDRVGAAAVDVN